jgi:hypothetical protein
VIVDAQEKKEIALPKLDALRAAWGEGSTVNEPRPDLYAQSAGWLGNGNLRVVFHWSGENDTRFEGAYTFNIVTGKIEDFAKAGSATGKVVTESANSGARLAMDKLVEAINNKDAEALQTLLQAADPDYYRDRMSVKQAGEAIEKIKFELDLGTIGYEEDKENGPYGGAPVYRLSGTKDGKKATIGEPIVLATVAGNLVYRWAYFSYLVFADDYTSEYLKLVQAGDAKKLADFLVVDDLHVTDAIANKMIEMYRLFFGSTDDLKLEYVGPFRYRVYKGDRQESHPVSVTYGDGLMGFDDTFMPSTH